MYARRLFCPQPLRRRHIQDTQPAQQIHDAAVPRLRPACPQDTCVLLPAEKLPSPVCGCKVTNVFPFRQILRHVFPPPLHFPGFHAEEAPPKGGKGRPAVFFRGLQGRKNLADWQIRLNFVPYNRIWHGTLQKKTPSGRPRGIPSVQMYDTLNFRSDISCSKS